jgi:hypothetical protein
VGPSARYIAIIGPGVAVERCVKQLDMLPQRAESVLRLRAALATSRSPARVGGTFALFGRYKPYFIRGSETRATIFASASQRALSLNVGRVLGRAVAVIPYVSIPARWAGIAACGSAIVFNWMPPAGRPRLLLARLPGPAVGCVRVRSQVATTSACCCLRASCWLSGS